MTPMQHSPKERGIFRRGVREDSRIAAPARSWATRTVYFPSADTGLPGRPAEGVQQFAVQPLDSLGRANIGTEPEDDAWATHDNATGAVDELLQHCLAAWHTGAPAPSKPAWPMRRRMFGTTRISSLARASAWRRKSGTGVAWTCRRLGVERNPTLSSNCA